MDHFSKAKRDNNPKRDFIIINKFQSKHFPSDPQKTVQSFSALGKKVSGIIGSPDGENCMVIGFAETAVAVGAYLAREIGERCLYVSTTREALPDHFPTLVFFEEHSHAAQHALCVRQSERFKSLRAVVLADDEFTTGSTAINLANALREMLPENCRIIAAGFIASDESRRNFAENGIECLAEYDFGNISNPVFPENFLPDSEFQPRSPEKEIFLNAIFDHRLGVTTGEFFAECSRQCSEILAEIPDETNSLPETVRVIGTEENCVLPIMLGCELAKLGCKAEVQGVTRSPMLPSDAADYPIKTRAVLPSLYGENRAVYLYNCSPRELAIILTDAETPSDEAVRAVCGAANADRVILVRQRGKTTPTSLRPEDCRLLLKDITGKITPLPAEKREPLIRSGVHYCELLAAEYRPSREYILQYEQGLNSWAKDTANAVAAVSERIYAEKGKNAVIVSLARAGTPAGVLISRYLKKKYGARPAHYSVSIIRGRGIDKNALNYILARHPAEALQFVDGWTGKGAIRSQLAEALAEFPELEPRLAVLADPAGVCELCGTRGDIFIPCACLNSTVSGLFSRTVLRSDLISPHDFHGAAYFGELANEDRTYEFIEKIESTVDYSAPIPPSVPPDNGGLLETHALSRELNITDINLVKPSVGETTRVLLRRIPKLVLLKEPGSPHTAHIEALAREKGVEIKQYPLEHYRAVGIIDNGAEA